MLATRGRKWLQSHRTYEESRGFRQDGDGMQYPRFYLEKPPPNENYHNENQSANRAVLLSYDHQLASVFIRSRRGAYLLQ